jgi:putative ABC transport system substrate-binding protein
VFDSGISPVELGWVTSLNQPGGNMTGVNQMVDELVTKQLGLLHQLIPQAQIVAVLVNANNPKTDSIVRKAQTAAGALGCSLRVLMAGSEQDLDSAFTTAVE